MEIMDFGNKKGFLYDGTAYSCEDMFRRITAQGKGDFADKREKIESHVERTAEMCGAMADSLGLTEKQKRRVQNAAWLHDIGKLIVPLEIMDKSTRLGDMEPEVMHRIEIAILMEKLMAARNPEYETESLLKIKRFEDARELIVRSNTAGFLEDETIDRLKTLAGIPDIQLNGKL